jgi:hypothetical protein
VRICNEKIYIAFMYTGGSINIDDYVQKIYMKMQVASDDVIACTGE